MSGECRVRWKKIQAFWRPVVAWHPITHPVNDLEKQKSWLSSCHISHPLHFQTLCREVDPLRQAFLHKDRQIQQNELVRHH